MVDGGWEDHGREDRRWRAKSVERRTGAGRTLKLAGENSGREDKVEARLFSLTKR